jgi:hypothetical protein
MHFLKLPPPVTVAQNKLIILKHVFYTENSLLALIIILTLLLLNEFIVILIAQDVNLYDFKSEIINEYFCQIILCFNFIAILISGFIWRI